MLFQYTSPIRKLLTRTALALVSDYCTTDGPHAGAANLHMQAPNCHKLSGFNLQHGSVPTLVPNCHHVTVYTQARILNVPESR